MARSGITKEDVRDAKLRLIERGQTITLDSLRIELGNTGSKTTIQRWLKELEGEDATLLQDKRLLSETLQITVLQLAKRLQEEASVQMMRTEAEYESNKTLWKEKEKKLEGYISDIDSQLKNLQNKISESEEENKRLNVAIQQNSLKIAELSTENTHQKNLLTTQAQHIQSLEEKHQHARQALEHYRASVQTQREQDQQRHEHQIQQLQAELRISQQETVVKQQEFSVLNEQAMKLSISLRNAEHTISEQVKKLESISLINQDLTRALDQKTMHLDELHKTHNQTLKKIDVIKNQLNNLQNLQIEWQMEKITLNTRLETQEQLWQQWVSKQVNQTHYFEAGESVIVTNKDHKMHKETGKILGKLENEGILSYVINFNNENHILLGDEIDAI